MQVYVLVGQSLQDTHTAKHIFFNLLSPEYDNSDLESKGTNKLGEPGTWWIGTCNKEKHILVDRWGWVEDIQLQVKRNLAHKKAKTPVWYSDYRPK